MPAIPQHIAQLLTAAVPAGTPILQPDQQRIPAEWEEEDGHGEIVEGGRRGLAVYIEQRAPQGYVQVEEPTAVLSAGVQDVYWTAVAAVAPSHEAARTLTDLIRPALIGVPGADPGFYRPQSPPSLLPLGSGVVMLRAVYARTLLA
ncbi:hypothetical protein GO986_09020 [Deinococcus sp. HMF7620]|uniref:Uncharacterized protein n=1 Tax=Deinococcus arboris TaxID=2682977 RepID=A0A7C9M650_9DEIO|nr:hypothetical protein [Deinococcus arboris]MVN86905.1 hypothetical protein [Deinococcus arboris]